MKSIEFKIVKNTLEIGKDGCATVLVSHPIFAQQAPSLSLKNTQLIATQKLSKVDNTTYRIELKLRKNAFESTQIIKVKTPTMPDYQIALPVAITPLIVKNLNYQIKKFKILKHISFQLPVGKLIALVGKNGAGKTTTIKCILNLITNYNGQILLNGIDAHLARARVHIAYIPEKEDLPNYSIRDFLLQTALYQGMKKKDALIKIHELCKDLAFSTNRLSLRTRELSSGLKKIIMIMQAFLSNASLIIADEPTANLDFDTRMLFYKLIKHLIAKAKITFLISSHDLFEIKEFADAYVHIKDGIVTKNFNINAQTRVK